VEAEAAGGGTVGRESRKRSKQEQQEEKEEDEQRTEEDETRRGEPERSRHAQQKHRQSQARVDDGVTNRQSAHIMRTTMASCRYLRSSHAQKQQTEPQPGSMWRARHSCDRVQEVSANIRRSRRMA